MLNKIKQLTGKDVRGYDSELVQAYSIEAHFTRGPDLSVALPNKRSFVGEIKVYSDPIDLGGKDVAIVKVDASNLPTVRLGDSDAAHAGRRVQTAAGADRQRAEKAVSHKLLTAETAENSERSPRNPRPSDVFSLRSLAILSALCG